MSGGNEKPTGAELAKKFSDADPQAQAAMLLDLLETDPAAMTEVLRARGARGDHHGPSAHGSSWPTHPGDHRNESTREGRGTQPFPRPS